MKIKRIVSQNRRDFHADYECEGCGHLHESRGYDDDNFHRNVIPNMKCPMCDKSSEDLGIEVKPLETKYPSWMTV